MPAIRLLLYSASLPQVLTSNFQKLIPFLLIQHLMSDKKELDEYEMVGDLGKGAYGKVELVKKAGKLYAMKQIEKKKLAKQKKEYQAFVEKELLRKIDHPGIIKLSKCFQDGKYLYYVLEYCHGGDFTNFITLYHQQLTNDIKKFYVAEIVCVLEYLHSVGITHRDLKPQNIMLSKDGHLKLIDFGTAEITRCTIVEESFKQQIAKSKKQSKPNLIPEHNDQQEEEMSPRKRKSTFVGTCFYLSPQLLELNICEAPSDLWALGCIIYQLYYLNPPFKAVSEFEVFEKIKNVEINYPKGDNISEETIDLIKRLIVKDPNERLGSGTREGLGFKDLKNHPYFAGINFENIFSQEIPEVEDTGKNEEALSRMEKINEEILSEHADKLKGQKVMMHGMVQKRSFAVYTLSYLIVEENFKTFEILPYPPYDYRSIKMQKIDEGKVVEGVSDDKFKIVANQTSLTIKSDKAKQWVEAITKSYMNSDAKE